MSVNVRWLRSHGLRDEVKFDSVDELRQQIARDFDNARAWLADNPATPET